MYGVSRTFSQRSSSKLESSNILWYACYMGIKVLPANNDWVFKLLFGDERNKSVLIDLLKSLVDLPEEEYDLVFLDTHLKQEFEEDKLGILDVKVRTRSGQIIDIEIQVEPQKHIAKRLSFYKSKMIVEQIVQSEHYDRIQRVICVCITSKTLFPTVGGTGSGFTTRRTVFASTQCRRRYTRWNYRRFRSQATEPISGNGCSFCWPERRRRSKCW